MAFVLLAASALADPGQAARLAADQSSLERAGAAFSPEAEAAALKQEALKIAETAAQSYPDDPLTSALLGSAFYNTGRSDEASKYLKRCLELRPEIIDAYEILARIAYEKGEPEEAIRICNEALRRGGPNPEILNRLGRALMDVGRATDAVLALKQTTGSPNPTSESCYLLGQAYMQMGEYAEAKEAFRRAIGLLSDHTQAYFGLFTACQRLGEIEQAARYREQFLKLEETDRKDLSVRNAVEGQLRGLPMVRETVARTLFGGAQIYRAHGQFQKASELLRKSALLDADNPGYRSALEQLFVQRKDPAGGVTAFEGLIAEQPENSLNYLFLGRFHFRLEQFDAAEKAYQRVQELAPNWSEGYRSLAELYLRANRKIDQASLLAGKAVQLEPSASNYYLLAMARLKTNDRSGALDAAQKALAQNPAEKKYQQLLQQINRTP